MTGRTVGFIGLGYMGEGMATNLLTKGNRLVAMAHRRREAIERLIEKGATEAATPAEMAAQCDAVFLCVTGSPEIEAIVRGKDGILAGMRPGMFLIDCSTAEPTSTDALAAEVAAAGGHFVDAPLGGTPAAAAAGTLQALVGADEETFRAVEPLIACWASTIVHVGRVGSGHRMKLVNNFLSMGYAALYAEALTLGAKVGLDKHVFHSVIGQGRMRCGFYDTFMKWVLERDENAHRFTIVNGYKDLRYLSAMADAAGVANPLGSAAKNTFAAFVAAGGGEKFVPMLADFVAELNGTKLD